MNDATAHEMAPHPIGHRTSEIGIIRGSYPFGEGTAGVIVLASLQFRSAWCARMHDQFGPGMHDASLVRQENRLGCRHFRIREASLASDASEHSGELVIIRLT